MIAELKKTTQEKMEKSLKALADELKKVRTGRAQVSMLDNVKVNYYGTMSPLSQVASISTPDAKSFMIAPWQDLYDALQLNQGLSNESLFHHSLGLVPNQILRWLVQFLLKWMLPKVQS